jgi:alpha-tubulin suppressor-like RCC1 family protein
MKKLLRRIITGILISLSLHSYSQTGTSCSNPFNLLSPIIGQTQNISDQWFQFSVSTPVVNISLTNLSGSDYISGIEIYGGTCADLVLVGAFNGYNGNQSFIEQSLPIEPGNIYIKAIKNTASSATATFNLSVSSGPGNAEFTQILCNNGEISSFGDNSRGQLGTGSTLSFDFTPQVIPGLTNVVAVSYGINHAMALTSSGIVYCWGNNTSGQCGQGTTVSQYNTPQQVVFPAIVNIVSIAAGAQHCLALGSNGVVYSWGSNFRGQLCDGTSGGNRISPYAITSVSGCTKMAAGRFNSYFVLANQTVVSCGDNQLGQIGNGTTGPAAITSPVAVTGISNVLGICAGQTTAYTLHADGAVRCWGYGLNGECGTTIPSPGIQATQALLPGFGAGSGIRDIAAGNACLYLLHTDGRMFFTGANIDKQAGCGLPNTIYTTVQTITDPLPAADLHSSCVAQHLTIINRNGLVATVGANRRGQLGTDTNTGTNTCENQAPNCCTARLPNVSLTPTPTAISCAGPFTTTLNATTTITPNTPNTAGWKLMQLQQAASAWPVISNNPNFTTAALVNTTGYVSHYIFQNSSEPFVAQNATTVTRESPLCCGVAAYNISAGSNSSTVFGTNATISNTTMVINGTFTINSNLTITNSTISMTPGSSIIINAGNTFTISNFTRLFSCTDMWNGITVNAGASFNSNGSCYIEDAINAVTSVAGGAFNVNGVIFNRNQNHIKVEAFGGTLNATVQACIFTCREIPVGFTSAQLQPLLFLLDKVNLKAPNSTTYTNAGILVNGNSAQIPVFTIGATSGTRNVFDAMNYGIRSSYAQLTIQNNIFQYFPGAIPVSGIPTGIGVFCSIPVTNISYTLSVGGTASNQGNFFFDCFRAVQIENHRTILVGNNRIFNTFTPTSFIGSGLTGNAGIHITHSKNNNTFIQNNTINNYATAIHFSRSEGSNSAQFSSNTINANVCGYVATGVFINDPVGNSFAGPLNNTQISSNTIKEANYGIRVNNVIRDLVISDNLEIGIRYSATGPRYGIWLTNCAQVQIKNNNNIHSSNRINEQVRGIFVQTSTNNYIACNTIFNVGQCLTFQGVCTSPTSASVTNYPVGILSNSFSNATDGFVLRNNGEIQTQGASNQPTGNAWGTNFIRSQTLADNTTTTNANSIMHNLSGLQPTNNLAINGGALYNFVGLPVATGIIPSCPAALAPFSGPLVNTLSVTTPFGNELDSLLADSTALPNWHTQTLLRRQAYVFSALQADPQLCSSSNTLLQFHTNCQNGNAGRFYDVNSQIAAEQYTLARQLNNSIIPQNTFEQNQKLINDLMLRRLINPNFSYTLVQRNQLNNLAAQCPETGGPAVHQARAWLDHINGTCTVWTDNCPLQPANNQRTASASQPKEASITIFPNPATKQATLSWELTDETVAVFTLFNAQGKQISSQVLTAQTGTLEIDIANLPAGVYFWSITQNNSIIKTDKLIVY